MAHKLSKLLLMNSIKVEYEVEQNKILDDMFKGSVSAF